MTKYILNSGGSSKYPAKAQGFYREVVAGLGSSPRVLMCYFAQPREHWETRYADHTVRCTQTMEEGVQPVYQLAMPAMFAEQLQWCDAVVISGGDDTLLQHYLRQYDLPVAWAGKVVAGSSAGANALATYYWTCDWRELQQGLGVVPVAFLPHFRSDFGTKDPRGPIDWDAAYAALEQRARDGDLQLHALEEGDYIIIEQ